MLLAAAATSDASTLKHQACRCSKRTDQEHVTTWDTRCIQVAGPWLCSRDGIAAFFMGCSPIPRQCALRGWQALKTHMRRSSSVGHQACCSWLHPTTDHRAVLLGAAGDWQQGKQHGQGACSYADGSCYQGAWQDGLRCGSASVTGLFAACPTLVHTVCCLEQLICSTPSSDDLLGHQGYLHSRHCRRCCQGACASAAALHLGLMCMRKLRAGAWASRLCQ